MRSFAKKSVKLGMVAVLALGMMAGCAKQVSGGIDWYKVTAKLQSRGKMLTNRGRFEPLPDAETLAQNFRKAAFGEESNEAQELSGRDKKPPVHLRYWREPIVYQVLSLGGSGRLQAQTDIFMNRLAKLTGHPISAIAPASDFPDAPEANVIIFQATDREMQRLIAADGPLTRGPNTYWRVVKEQLREALVRWRVYPSPCGVQRRSVTHPRSGQQMGETFFATVRIRAEVPEAFLDACIEEELGHVMGIGFDHRELHPSIFNDDQVFALLTRQDELMFRILYDPRLSPGMTPDEAMPIVREIARELVTDP